MSDIRLLSKKKGLPFITHTRDLLSKNQSKYSEKPNYFLKSKAYPTWHKSKLLTLCILSLLMHEVTDVFHVFCHRKYINIFLLNNVMFLFCKEILIDLFSWNTCKLSLTCTPTNRAPVNDHATFLFLWRLRERLLLKAFSKGQRPLALNL